MSGSCACHKFRTDRSCIHAIAVHMVAWQGRSEAHAKGRVSTLSMQDILGFFTRCFRPSLSIVNIRWFSTSDISIPNFFRSFEQTNVASFLVKQRPSACMVQSPKILFIQFRRKVPCGSNRFVDSRRFSSLRSSVKMFFTTHRAVCNLFSFWDRSRFPATMGIYRYRCEIVCNGRKGYVPKFVFWESLRVFVVKLSYSLLLLSLFLLLLFRTINLGQMSCQHLHTHTFGVLEFLFFSV